MKVIAEFIGYFRVKSGIDQIVLDLPENASVLDFARSVEKNLAGKNFSILTGTDGIELKNGVLLFRRNANGGLERCLLSDAILCDGERIILANLMGGG